MLLFIDISPDARIVISMKNLAETGMNIVESDVLAGNNALKLEVIRRTLELSPDQAKAAFIVLRRASKALKKIRQTLARA